MGRMGRMGRIFSGYQHSTINYQLLMSGKVDMEGRFGIARELLGGVALGEVWGGFCTCPGAASHSAKNGKKDFRVVLEGVPTGHCLHASCAQAVADFNRELRSRIGKLEHGGAGSVGGRREAGGAMTTLAPAGARQEKRLPLCRETVMKVVHGVPAVDRDWLRRRSPVDVSACGIEGFFASLYGAGERVLVFTRFTSQGDYLWEIPN